METYGILKTLVAVHTEDRDIKKWATQTQFELDLPVSYKNVVSLCLSDIDLPVPLYQFSPENQNTKMTVEYLGVNYTFEITPGHYETEAQLCNELAGRMNLAVGGGIAFRVYYNRISKKLVFANTAAAFKLHFETAETYDPCASSIYYSNHSNWGLGSFLGFHKLAYASSLGDVNFYWSSFQDLSVNIVEAPEMLNITGDAQIYLEVATYNNIDEMQPYQERSSDTYYGKYGGSHNASFARIPTTDRSSTKDYLSNIYFRDPPLERLQKLRFLFRYHDGRPVYFHNRDFSFGIEITTLRNEVTKTFAVNRNNYTLT